MQWDSPSHEPQSVRLPAFKIVLERKKGLMTKFQRQNILQIIYLHGILSLLLFKIQFVVNGVAYNSFFQMTKIGKLAISKFLDLLNGLFKAQRQNLQQGF